MNRTDNGCTARDRDFNVWTRFVRPKRSVHIHISNRVTPFARGSARSFHFHLGEMVSAGDVVAIAHGDFPIRPGGGSSSPGREKAQRTTERLARWSHTMHRVGSGSEAVAKHRQAALRFGFGRLVLQDVPVFGKAAVLDPDNIRGDPGNRPAGS